MWSEEEKRMCALDAMSAYHGEETIFIPPETLELIMTRAVELAAARGGTMTAEDTTTALIRLQSQGEDRSRRALVAHISAQGTRVAVLEAENAEMRRLLATRVEAVRLDAALTRLAAMRPFISQLASLSVEMAKVVGDRGERMPSLAHPHFGCHPCSPTCTHDDAATPGHPERVKERNEAVSRVVAMPESDPSDDGEPSEEEWAAAASLQDAHDRGAEAMRAACWEAVQATLTRLGFGGDHEFMRAQIKAAIEGAEP